MTTQERAEQIRELFRDESPVPDYLMPSIEAVIVQAEREAYDRGFKAGDHCTAQSIGKAYSDAIERCAEALDPLYVMKGSENDGMIYIPDAQKAIRALKGEGKP